MPRTKLFAILFGCLAAAPVSSSLIASIEDEGAAGGGGGATNDQAPGGASPASPAPVAPASTERTFTQADIDRIVADRLARDRAARGGATATSAPQQPPAPPAQDRATLTLAQRQEKIELETAFYRGLSRTGTALTEEQEADLFELFRLHKPEHPGEWLTRKIAAFGIGAKPQATAATSPETTPTVATAAATTPTTPAAPAAAGGAAPNGVDPSTSGGMVDVSKLTAAQIAQLGPKGIRAAVESVLASGQGRDGRPALPGALRKA